MNDIVDGFNDGRFSAFNCNAGFNDFTYISLVLHEVEELRCDDCRNVPVGKTTVEIEIFGSSRKEVTIVIMKTLVEITEIEKVATGSVFPI